MEELKKALAVWPSCMESVWGLVAAEQDHRLKEEKACRFNTDAKNPEYSFWVRDPRRQFLICLYSALCFVFPDSIGQVEFLFLSQESRNTT